MAIQKMPISKFVTELEAALNRKDGYIMGARGQNPKTGSLDLSVTKVSSHWKEDGWWYEQYSGSQREKALYWREHATRVWDCNGMAEGIYELFTGVNINSKARYNYSEWCDPKGTGSIPAQYRVPGAAVFIHSSSSGYITHVGYLYKPVDESNPAGDWYVIEARGVMYGVVKTKLNDRGWNRWGLMTKYFDYNSKATLPTEFHLGDRLLVNGYEGADVKELQQALIRLGYDCGKWGADGDFGDATELAVEKFQKDQGLTVDGMYGSKTNAALEKALANVGKTVENPKKVKIVGGDCWVRSASNTGGKKLGVAHAGDVLVYGGQTAENGWHCIVYKNQNAWVSGKYSKLEG